MDQFDQASEIEATFNRRSLAAQLKKSQNTGVSMAVCVDCGEPISEARRQAAPGCIRCLNCQESYEEREE